MPTGVGFCMYMTAQALDAVGELDAEAFGRGYGEENDWCLRAEKAGFRNLLAEDVYVYHAGQISFARRAAAGRGAYDQGQAALLSKHPDYLARVGQFVQADPGRQGRARLDLARLARHLSGRALLFVTHSWGGGIQRHLDDLIAQARAEGTPVVLLQIDRTRNLEVHVAYRGAEALYLPNLASLYLPRDAEELSGFVATLAPRLIHVHSLAGLRWAAARALMDVVAGSRCPTPGRCTTTRRCATATTSCSRTGAIAVWRRCPSAGAAWRGTRTGSRSRIRGSGGPRSGGSWAGRRGCLRRPPTRRGGSRGCTQIWVSRCGRTPSRSGRCAPPRCTGPAASGAWPCWGDQRHEGRAGAAGPGDRCTDPRPAVALCPGGLLRSRAGRRPGGRRRHADRTLRERQRGAGSRLARRGGPDPAAAIWPETYSYALTLALRTGLPVAAFDLGAPADRLRADPDGHLLPYALADDPSACNDRLLAIPLPPPGHGRTTIEAAAYDDLMADYYGLAPEQAGAGVPHSEDAA